MAGFQVTAEALFLDAFQIVKGENAKQSCRFVATSGDDALAVGTSIAQDCAETSSTAAARFELRSDRPG